MARDFNGTTDRIDYSNVFNPVGTNSTIGGWVNADSFIGWNEFIFCIGQASNIGIYNMILRGDGSNVTFRFEAYGSTELDRYSTAIGTEAAIAAGWKHFLITWDGSTTATNAHLYVDGTEVSYATTTNGATLSAQTGLWSLGGQGYDDVRNLDCQLAEFAAWNRILSADEITALSKKYAPSHFPYLLKWYAPLGGFGPTANDVYGKAATLDGTTAIDHIGMIYPHKQTMSFPVVVAGGRAQINPVRGPVYMRRPI